MLTISPIPAFNDNYIWLIENGQQEAFVVDPGDPEPVLAELKRRNLTLKGVLVTHHHLDHIGGLKTLRQRTGCKVWGPDNPAIRDVDTRVSEGDQVKVLGTAFHVLAVPGHTLDHLAYSAPGTVFVGDTLFAGGCGRLFEGTPATMRNSLGKLLQLPDNTKVYCAHEYTQANLRFAVAADGDNTALRTRVSEVDTLRARGVPTVPTTMALEKATNPFLRWESSEIVARLRADKRLGDATPDQVFAALRTWKDNF